MLLGARGLVGKLKEGHRDYGRKNMRQRQQEEQGMLTLPQKANSGPTVQK